MHITSKGQVTIPRRLREKYRLYPNTEVEFLDDGERVYLKKSSITEPVRESPFDTARGVATVRMSTEEIMGLTRGDGESDQ